MEQYQKHTRKLSWLAQGTRPDLIYIVLKMYKKNGTATIGDLQNVIKVFKGALPADETC